MPLQLFESPQVRAWSTPYWDHVQLTVRDRRNGRLYVAQPLTMSAVEDGAVSTPATVEIGLSQAQTLMDDLWLCGLRPSEGTGSAGALAATQKHLEDMRNLVFKSALKIQTPKPKIQNVKH